MMKLFDLMIHINNISIKLLKEGKENLTFFYEKETHDKEKETGILNQFI